MLSAVAPGQADRPAEALVAAVEADTATRKQVLLHGVESMMLRNHKTFFEIFSSFKLVTDLFPLCIPISREENFSFCLFIYVEAKKNTRISSQSQKYESVQ